MDKWKVLPTESRFQDLTEEQLDYLYENWLRLNPPKQKPRAAAEDPDYEAEEGARENYSDPDFDEYWNNPDSADFSGSNSVGKTIAQQGSEGQPIPSSLGVQIPSIPDKWEEV